MDGRFLARLCPERSHYRSASRFHSTARNASHFILPTMKILAAIGALAVLLGLGGLAYLLSGGYDIAATSPHWTVTRRLLSNTMDRSVERHAREIVVTVEGDSSQLRAGFDHYSEMCVECHSSPGAQPTEIARGLNPKPPNLTKLSDEWSDAQLFWIVKNGVKMSGMPASGPTHSDEEIWNIVRAVKKLPGMSAQEYEMMTSSGGEPDEAGHQHEDGTSHSHND